MRSMDTESEVVEPDTELVEVPRLFFSRYNVLVAPHSI